MPIHHAVAVPAAAQGHMNPLMRFCKALARDHGFTVTFVTVGPMAEHMAERSDAQPSPERIRVTSIPAPAAPAEARSGFRMSLTDFNRSVNGALDEALGDLIRSLSSAGPPVTCLISDVFLSTATQKVSDELDLPRIVFVPASQAFTLLLAHMSSGVLPFDEAIRAAQQRDQRPLQPIGTELPGLPALVYRDLVVCKHLLDETEELARILCENVRIALANKHGRNTFVVNSFLELEGPAFQAQAHLANASVPPVFPIGPLLEDLSSHEATNTSLWKEDDACLAWLGGRPPRSVLFISFGSITLFSKPQFEELLLGLEASSQSFLLVFRPDLVDDPSYTSLPEDFLSRTKGRGCSATWVPQLRVLSHPSVGGFLTHCGWNSTIEAVANGVPMLCWPYFADQHLDAKYIVEEWKIGLRVEPSHCGDSLVVGRADIELLIRALMQSSSGEALRENAMRLSSIAKACQLPTGSSYKNIQAVVKGLS